jgi:hypothetical protein
LPWSTPTATSIAFLDDMIPSLIEDILRIANVTGKRYLPPSEKPRA